jgi:asparaginyl-tRNA synthetase
MESQLQEEIQKTQKKSQSELQGEMQEKLQIKLQGYLKPHSLCELNKLYETNKIQIQDVVTKFYGWIRRIRTGDGGRLIFVDIYDGTTVGSLMCLATHDFYIGNDFKDDHYIDELTDSEQFETLKFEQLNSSSYLSSGCSVVVDGKLVFSPTKATQNFEMEIFRLRVICGVENPNTYPIQKSTEKQVSALRKYPFVRIRSQIAQSVFRISSKTEYAIHTFMDDHNVQKVDPNIVTMSDCEGAGETFNISPLIFSRDNEGKELPVGLTVSSQLPLESSITGFKHVYTAQKSFRAEKSDTPKHLAEFFHIEYESAFTTLDKLLDFTEKFVKFVITYTFSKCKDDFDFIESKFAPTDIRPTRELLSLLIKHPFVRIKYCDAVSLIKKIVQDKIALPDDNGTMKRVKLKEMPRLGQDLGSEHEKLLIKYFGWKMLSDEEQKDRIKNKQEFGAFVFVTHWPLHIKSFYMKQCDDGSDECESFDLLAPRVGELFGGSMREWRFEKLTKEIERRKMNITPIQWFIDLRKSGSTPHGGWGMGFARMCMLLTGVPSVRDVVYLPVYYGHCPY